MIRNIHFLCASVFLLGLLIAAPSVAAPVDTSATPVVLPIGVADQAGKFGFVPAAKGGIEALNLETGEVLWDVKAAGKPLVAWDKFLAAQVGVADKANTVRIVLLDTTQKGQRVLESDPVVFPEWVSVGVTYGRTFSSQGQIHKGNLLLHWEANAFYAGGAAPTPEILEASRKKASGIARVNLESGKVVMFKEDKAAPDPKVKLPADLATVASRQYWTGSDWKTVPFVFGNTISALGQKDVAGVQQLSLKRWDLMTGKPLETVEMLRGKELWPQLSLDGRHLFVHQALVKEQLPPGDYAWWIFALDTGKQLGKIPYESALNNVTVLGPRAFYLVGNQRGGPFRPGGNMTQTRSLRALDLKTGKVAWERPVEGQRVLLPLP